MFDIFYSFPSLPFPSLPFPSLRFLTGALVDIVAIGTDDVGDYPSRGAVIVKPPSAACFGCPAGFIGTNDWAEVGNAPDRLFNTICRQLGYSIGTSYIESPPGRFASA